MPIVPVQGTLTNYLDLAVSMPRYAQIVSVSECAFWGVNNPADADAACSPIWQLPQRSMVEQALAESQEELERFMRYPLTSRWFAETNRPWRHPVLTERGHLVALGVRAVTTIALATAVSHATDPAVIGPIATTVTSVDEVHVYFAGTSIEVIPSSITIAGGNVTIGIPRCRLVAPANANNPEEGWDYTDTGVLGPFAQTVDVKRVYNDTTTTVAVHALKCDCTLDTTIAVCGSISQAELGAIEVLRTSCSSLACACTCGPQVADLYYKAGWTLTPQQEEMVVRLAHSKMPDEPCACDSAQMMWRRDRNVPMVLSAERLNCPFGLNDGAWIVYQFATQAAMRRGSTL